MFRHLMEARITQPQGQLDQTLMEEIEKKIIRLLQKRNSSAEGEKMGSRLPGDQA